ncbi:hypothetical protein niasHT_032475 [Heterodera trifolii]|uniref:Uncharacterized protein n=1 Tax=Heterodera trifolii TaxID=157864 RepID=A0ABD2J728_9BILA
MIRKYHPLAKELMSFHAQYQKTLEEQGPESVINFRLTLVEAREAPLNIRDPSLHPRQANLPDEGNSLFAIWAENDQPPILKGIWITTDEGKLQKFVPHHPQTDSLCYPSLFPHGDDGFHPKIPYNLKNRKRNDEAMEVDVASDDNDENSFDSDDNEPADDTESIASSVDSTEKTGTATVFIN